MDAVIISILTGDDWDSSANVIVVADLTSKRLTWIPPNLWSPTSRDCVDRAFAAGGGELLGEIVSEFGFQIGSSLCLKKSATRNALRDAAVHVAVKERLDFWHPVHPMRPIEHGRKKVSFLPPGEILSGERIHQWLDAKLHVNGSASDAGRMRRQQVFFQALLDSKFDFGRFLEDPALVNIVGRSPLETLAQVDSTWKIETFSPTKGIVLDCRHVQICKKRKLPRTASANTTPEMAVVILSVGAPPELTEAIKSILRQEEPVELVVVNSGGGNVEERIPEDAKNIKYRSFEEILWAGAARNRGIEMTSAPYLAFLAADCRAMPHWIERRMDWHRGGAEVVASSVVSDFPKNILALASHLALFSQRIPGLPAKDALRYGASYSRRIFQEFGLFREDLRIGEDTELHQRIAKKQILWEPGVKTIHRTPGSLFLSMRDQYLRGKRSACYWPQNSHVTLRTRFRKQSLRILSNIQSGLKADERKYAFLAFPFILLNLFAYELGRKYRGNNIYPVALHEANAGQAWNKGLWQKALDEWSESEKHWPDRPAPMEAKARCLMKLERYEEAEKMFQQMQLAWPNLLAGYEGAAHAAEKAGRWSVSAEYWAKSDALLPGRLKPLFGRADALVELREFDKAQALFRLILASRPNVARAHFGLASVALEKKDYASALSIYGHLWDALGNTKAIEQKVELLLELERKEEAEAIVSELQVNAPAEAVTVSCTLALLQHRHDWHAVAELLIAHEHITLRNTAYLNILVTALTRLGRHGEALDFVQRFKEQHTLSYQLTRIQVLLQAKRRSEANEFLQKLWEDIQIDRVPVNYFSAMITAAWENGGAPSAYQVLDMVDKTAEIGSRMPIQQFLSHFQRARILNLENLFKISPELTVLDEDLEMAVARTAQRTGYSELFEVCETFSALRKKCPQFYPDSSFVFSDALAVVERILSAVESKQPLSLIRLGDGEGIFLPYREKFSEMKQKDLAAIQRAWWGDSFLGKAHIEILGQELQDSIDEADILGIPDVERMVRATVRHHAPGASNNSNSRGVYAVLDATVQIGNEGALSTKLLTSCHIHQALDYWGLWDLLLPAFQSVSLITCRDRLGEILSKRHNLGIEKTYIIPPEKKGATGGLGEQRHYPHIYQEIRTELSKVSPGHVVLVAAGFLGKVYCQQARMAGGIAIDIGSAADIWCGYDTRELLSTSEHTGPNGLRECYSKFPDNSTLRRLLAAKA